MKIVILRTVFKNWVHFSKTKHITMKVIIMSDQALIAAIKRGGLDRNRAIRQLYKEDDLRRKVIYYVKQNNGSPEEGMDIWHEGIIVLDRNVRQDKFREETSVHGYLYSICRFLWMNQVRKNAKMDFTDDMQRLDEVETETPETQIMEDESKNVLKMILEQIGERCQKILELWKLSYSMEEIAAEVGFSSAAMARKNKYRCHKRLLELLEKNPKLNDLLRNV